MKEIDKYELKAKPIWGKSRNWQIIEERIKPKEEKKQNRLWKLLAFILMVFFLGWFIGNKTFNINPENPIQQNFKIIIPDTIRKTHVVYDTIVIAENLRDRPKKTEKVVKAQNARTIEIIDTLEPKEMTLVSQLSTVEINHKIDTTITDEVLSPKKTNKMRTSKIYGKNIKLDKPSVISPYAQMNDFLITHEFDLSSLSVNSIKQ